MIKYYATLFVALLGVMRTRVEEAKRDERGLGTLEMVVLALGLFLAATAVIVVITAAITSRTSKIQ